MRTASSRKTIAPRFSRTARESGAKSQATPWHVDCSCTKTMATVENQNHERKSERRDTSEVHAKRSRTCCDQVPTGGTADTTGAERVVGRRGRARRKRGNAPAASPRPTEAL